MSLSPRQRRNRNRRRKDLARLGALTYRAVWPDATDYDTLLTTCVAWKKRWLVETGRVSEGFAIQNYDRFLAGLDGDAATLTGACLFVVEASETPVAIEFGVICDGHYYAYIGGFDWTHRASSPGKVAMEFCQRWLFEAGVARYDLLGNPAEYKSSWTNTTVSLQSYSCPLNLRGQVLGAAWLEYFRPALKRVYLALPYQVRRAVAARTGGSRSAKAWCWPIAGTWHEWTPILSVA